MNPEDRELQRRLRQIEVPSDLKNRLRQIPNDAAERIQPATNTDSQGDEPSYRPAGWVWIPLAIAASLAGLSLYLFWPAPPRADESVAVEQTSEPSGKRLTVDNQTMTEPPLSESTDRSSLMVENSATSNLLDEMAAELNQLDQLVVQIKVHRLSEQVRQAEHKQSRQSNRSTGLSPNDRASMVMSLSNQAALQMGVDKKIVERNFADVIEKFPGTRGSQWARQGLNTEL